MTIGYPLPSLLRRLYTEVANGGFGPMSGIVGVRGGHAYQRQPGRPRRTVRARTGPGGPNPSRRGPRLRLGLHRMVNGGLPRSDRSHVMERSRPSLATDSEARPVADADDPRHLDLATSGPEPG